MKKPVNQIKTEFGNIDKDRYLDSTMIQGKKTIKRFKKWLRRQNKLLGTNFTIDDFKE